MRRRSASPGNRRRAICAAPPPLRPVAAAELYRPLPGAMLKTLLLALLASAAPASANLVADGSFGSATLSTTGDYEGSSGHTRVTLAADTMKDFPGAHTYHKQRQNACGLTSAVPPTSRSQCVPVRPHPPRRSPAQRSVNASNPSATGVESHDLRNCKRTFSVPMGKLTALLSHSSAGVSSRTAASCNRPSSRTTQASGSVVSHSRYAARIASTSSTPSCNHKQSVRTGP